MSQVVQVDSCSSVSASESELQRLRNAQTQWAARSVSERLRIMRNTRHRIVEQADELAQAIDLPQRRDLAESIAAEVFPLADAIQFLERNARRLLKPIRERNRDRPSWGRGLKTVTHRDPLGVVLIIGTWNYPLFLTGVQIIQALVAGNAVIVKPGAGCHGITELFVRILVEAGLPNNLISLRDEDTDAAKEAIARGVDKVVFTGSATTGRAVMAQLAKHGTPSVMELSGSDAVFILPSADLNRVVKCLHFGTNINSGATCIAPRRVFATSNTIEAIKSKLLPSLRTTPPVSVHPAAGQLVSELITANQKGIRLLTPDTWPNWKAGQPFPITVLEVHDPEHPILQQDIFAPVLSLIRVNDMKAALRQDADCPYALGASVFGNEREAQTFAKRIDAGCVVINDMVAPTADPRASFGGRRRSGFGSTRGAAGLLEMTQIKTIVTQGSNWLPHLDPPIPELGPLLLDFLRLAHGRGWRQKWSAMTSLMHTGRDYWSKSRNNTSP